MTLKPLGTTGVQIPSVGFGTWNYTAGAESLAIAIDHGARFIDTAETYGTEELVGQAMRGRRADLFLASKVRPANFRYRDVIRAAENSLRRLCTEYIDLYQLHWPNYTVPIEETMAAMECLADAGKIRFIGVSNFPVHELKLAHTSLGKHPLVSNQLRYSLIERTIESGLLQYCRQMNITVLAYSPLGTTFSQFSERDPEGVLAKTAKKYGISPAQIALNWVVKKAGVVAIAKASSIEHVREDCVAAEFALSDEDYRQLESKILFSRRGQIESFVRKAGRLAFQLFGRGV